MNAYGIFLLTAALRNPRPITSLLLLDFFPLHLTIQNFRGWRLTHLQIPLKFSWLDESPRLTYASSVELNFERTCHIGYERTMLSSVAVANLCEPITVLQSNGGRKLQCDTKRSILTFKNSLEIQYVHKLHVFSNFRSHCSKLRSHHPWRTFDQGIPKRLLCQLDNNASDDDDYGSSRNIAISLFKRYRNVIDRGGGDNLKEFINAGVNAYALGCTDEGLRKELIEMKNSGTEIEGLETCRGGTGLRFKILSEEIHECILWLSIVFITILCTPQPTIVRWSSTPPVSTEIMLQWKGFCALIANAYYTRGMAWLPVKTLQLEQMAVLGSAEEPSVVASRMRLVFSTLEVVSPQWPRV